MKDSVQTHFQNMETDEGCFVDYFPPFYSVIRPLGKMVCFETIFLPASCPQLFFSFFQLDQERIYVLSGSISDKWLGFETRVWRAAFFFLAFIFPLGYEVYNMHEYVFKKIMYIIHIAPSHAFCIALHVIDTFC